MRGSMKLVSMLLVLWLMLGALPLAMAEEVVDADLTCTITLGNWPADTAAEAEKAAAVENPPPPAVRPLGGLKSPILSGAKILRA